MLFVEMVQKSPDGPKWSKTSRLTLLDPFEPLWHVDKPAIIGHFCLFCSINFSMFEVNSNVVTIYKHGGKEFLIVRPS